jgi:sugar phosphate isomerase/epimerase
MRHDATFGYPDDHTGEATFESALPTLIKGCQAVADYAATKGVKTMVENHGFFAQGSIKNEQIVKGVDHDNFGALVDIGNFLCDDEDPVSATRRMAPLALHAHAKDFHVKPADAADPGKGWLRTNAKQYLRGSIIGHGNIDIPGCLRALKEGGYSGPVSVEFEGLEDNNEALTIGLENLRRYAAEVYGD